MSNRKYILVPSSNIASFHLTHGPMTRLDSWSPNDRATACALLAQISPAAMARIIGPGILDQIVALVEAKGPHSHKAHWRKVGCAIEEFMMAKGIAIDDVFDAMECAIKLHQVLLETDVVEDTGTMVDDKGNVWKSSTNLSKKDRNPLK